MVGGKPPTENRVAAEGTFDFQPSLKGLRNWKDMLREHKVTKLLFCHVATSVNKFENEKKTVPSVTSNCPTRLSEASMIRSCECTHKDSLVRSLWPGEEI